MKRATISAKFPSLTAHKSEISAAAIASTNTAAIAKAVRNLFAHPQVKGKQIHSVVMAVSLINLDQSTIEQIMNKADGITEETEESEEEETKIPDGFCKYCKQEVESLVRHLSVCESKPAPAKAG